MSTISAPKDHFSMATLCHFHSNLKYISYKTIFLVMVQVFIGICHHSLKHIVKEKVIVKKCNISLMLKF